MNAFHALIHLFHLLIRPLSWLLSTTQSPRSTRGGASFLMLGESSLNNASTVEWALKSRGYPAPEFNGVSSGGGGYFQVGRLLIGGSGEGTNARAENDIHQSAVGAGSGMANVGWLLLERGGLRVYPLIGAGGSGTGMSVQPKNRTSQGVSITGGGANILAGVGVEFRLRITKSFAPLIGVRIGVMLSTPTKWNGMGFDPSELSESQRLAPYFRLMLGTGRMR